MQVFSFQLFASFPYQVVSLRELNGHDELRLNDTGTSGVLQLLNDIMVQQLSSDNTQVYLKAEKISVSDRDYLIANVYKNTYGSRIESSLRCDTCRQLYDVNFSLDDLVKHHVDRRKNISVDSDGFFYNDNGLRFRLPNGEDEMAVFGLPPDEAELAILNRCLTQPPNKESKTIIEAMEEVGPVLTTDLGVNCPECGAAQNVRFDLQSFLLGRLKNERKKFAVEVHSIAFAYGWSHQEILDLPRSMRQTYASLISKN